MSSIKRMFGCLLIFMVLVTVTPAQAAGEGDNTLRLLLPWNIGWVWEAAEEYTARTGVKVEITATQNNLPQTGSSQAGLADARAAVEQGVVSGDYDLVYTWGLPAEYMADPARLVDLSAIVESDPDFDLSQYHAGVMSAHRSDEGWYTMPLVFDVPLLAVNSSRAAELGIADDLYVGISRAEYTAACAAAIDALEGDDRYDAPDPAWIDTGADATMRYDTYYYRDTTELTGTYVTADGWRSWSADIPVAFVTEAMTLLDGREISDADLLATIMSDYDEYYSTIESNKKSFTMEYYANHWYYLDCENYENLVSLSVAGAYAKLLLDGTLVTYTAPLSEIGKLTADENIALYTFPTSQPDGMFVNVEGLAIVDTGKSELAWEFIKYMLSDEVQSEVATYPVLNAAREDAITETFADGSSVLDYVNSLERFSEYRMLLRDQPNKMLIRDYAYSAAHYFTEICGHASIGVLNMTDYAYVIANAVAEDLEIPESKIGTGASVFIIVIGVALAAVIVFALVLILRGILALTSGYREMLKVTQQKVYGKRISFVRGRRIGGIIVAVIALAAIAALMSFMGSLENFESALPMQGRRLMIWVFIAIAAVVAIVSLWGALVSRLVLCEKGIVIVTGFKVVAIYADEIERISTEGRTCIIVTHSRKPVELRSSMYHDLKEKLDAYSRDVLAEIQKENG